MKKVISMIAMAAIVIGSVSSCKKSDDEKGKAKVMVVHASPDAPGVDVLVDNNKVNTSALSYPNNTGYLQVEEGTRNLKVNAAGTSTTVINADVPFAKDKNYSVFAIDSLSVISALVTEDNLAAPASGKAHVRFIHLSPNAPAVDVALKASTVLFPAYEFKDVSAFTPLDQGTYDLEVRLAGTSPAILPLPGITLTAGKIYTIFAKGFVGGTGAQALGAQIIVNN